MEFTTRPLSVVASLLIGGIIGYFGGPALVLLPWAIVGFVIGAFCRSRQAALLNGVAYGFALGYVFMITGYSGSDPLSTKLLPFVVLGIVGAFFGVVATLLGFVVGRRIRQHR